MEKTETQLSLEQIEEADFGDEKRIEAVDQILKWEGHVPHTESVAKEIIRALNEIDWERLDRNLSEQIRGAISHNISPLIGRYRMALKDGLPYDDGKLLAEYSDKVTEAVAEIGRIINRSTDEYSGLMMRQAELLRGVVNALRGDPPPLTHWSHHDAVKLAEIASAGGKLWIVDTVEGLAKLPDYAVIEDATGVRWCKSSLDPVCWNSLAGHMGRSNKAMALPVTWWRDGEE